MKILDIIVVLFYQYNVIEAQYATLNPGDPDPMNFTDLAIQGAYPDLLEDGLLAELTGQHKPESQYYPYWKNGHWVYNRGPSTRVPQAYTLYKGTDVQHRECDQVCTNVYSDYGPICAAMLSRRNWTYIYKDYANMCELEFYNCRFLKSRYYFYPLYKGTCVKTKEAQMHMDPWKLLDMAKKLNETFPEDDSYIIPQLLNKLKTSPKP